MKKIFSRLCLYLKEEKKKEEGYIADNVLLEKHVSLHLAVLESKRLDLVARFVEFLKLFPSFILKL